MVEREEGGGTAERAATRIVLWLLLSFLASGAVFLIVEPVLRLIGVRG